MTGAPKYDMEPPPLGVFPTPRWIRVRSGDRWIADSREALLYVIYGPGRLPTYAFHERDLDMDGVAELPDGVARQLGDDDPAELAGMWTFAWDGRVRWFEEAEEVFVHATDRRCHGRSRRGRMTPPPDRRAWPSETSSARASRGAQRHRRRRCSRASA